jgi:acyl-CoA hydrolase
MFGRTSMRIKVKAWRPGRSSEEKEMITEAILAFVTLDANGRPSPPTA